MKLAIVALSLFAMPAIAQDHSGHAMPSPAAPAAAGTLTIDTPIETIAADPKGKAVLDTVLPTLTQHPMYDQFRSMSLVQLQPVSGGALTDEQVAKVKDALAAIK
jgi:hypothetical protein